MHLVPSLSIIPERLSSQSAIPPRDDTIDFPPIGPFSSGADDILPFPLHKLLAHGGPDPRPSLNKKIESFPDLKRQSLL